MSTHDCRVFVKLIPPHEHGSKYRHDLGCPHPKCLEAATRTKSRLRKRRRLARIIVNGRFYHPGLAPVDSDEPKRHGTAYGRTEFGCCCADCNATRHRCSGVLASVMITTPVKDPRWHRHLAHLFHGNFTIDLVVAIVMFTTFAVVAHWDGIVHGWEFAAAVLCAAVAATAHRPPGRHRVLA